MASNARTVTVNIVGDSSGYEKAAGKVASSSEASGGRVSKAFGTAFATVAGSAGGALAPITEAFEHMGGLVDSLKEKGKTVGSVLLGAGGAAAGIGAGLTAFGSKDQEAQQQLKVAVENSGHAYEDYAKDIDGAVKGGERFGNQSNATMNALQILTQSTKDPAKALQYLGTAQDLSAAKHESLTAAAETLATVLAGKGTRALAQFGIAQQQTAVTGTTVAAATKAAATADDEAAKAKQRLADLQAKDAAKGKLTIADQQALKSAQDGVTAADERAAQAHRTLTADQDALANSGMQGAGAVDQLAQKLKGQASAAADSTAGRFRALKAEIEDGAARIGQKYGPAVTALGTAMAGMGATMELGTSIVSKFTRGQEVAAGATEALTGAEDAEVVSEGLALAPILLIIAAIALLGVGIYELVTHWSTVWKAIKTATSDAINFIKGIIGDVVGWIQGHWQLLLAILTGPFGLAVLFVKDHFNDMLSFVQGIPNRIAGIASGMWDSIVSTFEGAINRLVDMWNGLHFTLPSIDFGPIHLGGETIGVPSIPHVAQGGLAYGPTLALVGDNPGARSDPEVIAPLSRLGGMMPAGGGGDIVLQIDGQTFARVAGGALQSYWLRNNTRNGVRGVGIG